MIIELDIRIGIITVTRARLMIKRERRGGGEVKRCKLPEGALDSVRRLTEKRINAP